MRRHLAPFDAKGLTNAMIANGCLHLVVDPIQISKVGKETSDKTLLMAARLPRAMSSSPATRAVVTGAV